MDYSEVFRFVNLGVGVVMVLGGISQYFNHLIPSKVQSIIVGSYVIIFGLGTALLEFQIHPLIERYAKFMFSFLGRGIFYIFVGSILLSADNPRYIAGSIICLIGVGYCALEFLPQIEPPQNMRDAEAGYEGGEQV